jgi:hypothetical protein
LAWSLPRAPAGRAVAQVVQSLQLGTVDGEPFRAEVTLLPGTKTVTWNGRQVPTRIHQHVAYPGGRILEVALDWYAQADDGSVWYFGDDLKAAAAERALQAALGPRLP